MYMAKHTRKVNTPLPPAFKIQGMPTPAVIIIHGKDNKKILEIEFDGSVIWHAENQASEAADVFCRQLSLGVEHKAGIKKSRKEWEEEKKESIREALEAGELTMEKLNEIFKKHEFVRRLAGDRTDDE